MGEPLPRPVTGVRPTGAETMSDYDKRATTLQGVSTLLALPQWYLNERLSDLLEGGVTPDGKSLKDVRLPIDDAGDAWLTGTIAELGVVVTVPGSVGKVVFTVEFLEGTMDFYDITVAPPKPSKCDVAGLKIGFLVDLAKAGVPAERYDRLSGDLRERIAPLPRDAFTIEQLFLDFENADLVQYDKASTTFPKKMTAAAIGVFPTYLATYLERVRAADGHVLGYTVVMPEWTDPVATFPPSSLDFTTNRYRGAKPAPGDADLDSVQYLMMTGNAPLPDNLKPWWGNFVTPDDGIGNTRYGTIAMAKEAFVDGYLLPSLAGVLCAHFVPQDNDENLDLMSSAGSGTFTPTATGGTWSSGQLSGYSHKTNSVSNDHVVLTSSWDAAIEFTPGAPTVVIRRNLDFTVDYTHWYGIEDHAAKVNFWVRYHVPQTLTMTLDGADDGALQVTVVVDTPQPDPLELYDMPYGWLIADSGGSQSIWAGVQETLEKTVDTIVTSLVDRQLGDQVEDDVQRRVNLAPFVYPGGSQLFLVDPVFNNAGDLLFGVSHKL
ncbi:hypothetical protein [Lentzea cavernae]|uniref:hypothetical protein n=1 Tax=Lentzea cavernae TaxID=2020703 RepID=UPI00174B959A|nr:hypothetical protein [Lentzea cavernae]